MSKRQVQEPMHAVLCYRPKRVSQTTVKRYYEQWRQAQGLSPRCDRPNCRYHTEPLIWNGKRLPLILDHIEGNRFDNRPEKLRYLCPNCDSQLLTRGGANRGRVERTTENGFILISQSGTREYTYFGSIKVKFKLEAVTSYEQTR